MLSVLLGSALLTACLAPLDPPGLRDLLGEGERLLEGFSQLGPALTGYALVRRPDGTVALVVIDDDNRELPDSAPIVPEVVGRSDPFGGAVKDLEFFIVPAERQPPGLNDPLLQAEPGELTPELLAERRRRLDERRRERVRYVVVTEEPGSGGPVCVIRVFDGDGQLIATTRQEGAFVKTVANDITGEKAVLTRQAGGQAFVLLDFVTGEVRVASGFALDADDDIQDVNAVGGLIVVFDTLGDRTRVRVRIFGPEGPPPRHVIEIPGTIAERGTLTNRASVKSVVTVFEEKVYNDLIEVITGRRLGPIDAQGLAQNPITGVFADHQFHRVRDQDSFLVAVYNAGRDETEVRILDAAGRIVATVVLEGDFRSADVRDGQKIFVSRRRDGAPIVTRVDLATGRVLQ
jgi:hypothetical protein